MNKSITRMGRAVAIVATIPLIVLPQTSAAIEILLTNDDGWDAPGISAAKGALEAAGHTVTVVAPLNNQSGVGGGLNTGVGSFVNVIEEAASVWSVDSTPADSVRAGLGAVLASNPPDLVISGANFGQNISRQGVNASGTVGAALQAMQSGVPAIAISVGLDLSESSIEPIPFPSTFSAFGPSAAFLARLVATLEATVSTPGDPLL